MKRKLPRRLIQVALACVFIAAPTIWLARQMHQQTLNRALIAAIKRSDAATVDSLLAAGANPNTRDTPIKPESFAATVRHLFHPLPPDLSPPVLTVAMEQRVAENSTSASEIRIVSALLAKGADPNVRDERGIVPVGEVFSEYRVQTDAENAADVTEDEALIDLLLRAGADIEAPGEFGETPLMDACSAWPPVRTEIARILITHGANVNAKPVPEFKSPLAAVIESGNADIANLLKSHGAKE